MTNKQSVTNEVNDLERRQAKYEPVARLLRNVYGDLEWRRDLDGMDELVSCILSQNTNDINRDRGLTALKARYPDWQAVVDAPTAQLEETIRPAGLANQKAPRIQAALRTIYDERGEYNIDFLDEMNIDEAKAWLTRLKGVGPKTAAIVLCFAYNREAFPVDTHVYRVSKRIGFLPEKISVDKAHDLMEAIVPPKDYYGFHILLIRHGRDTCTARIPHCERCPLTDYCDYFLQISEEAGSPS